MFHSFKHILLHHGIKMLSEINVNFMTQISENKPGYTFENYIVGYFYMYSFQKEV
jgi:flavodoxin